MPLLLLAMPLLLYSNDALDNSSDDLVTSTKKV